MKKNVISFWILILSLSVALLSCSKNDNANEEPAPVSKAIAKNIVGKWLLASSDSENWVSYEFTESARINAEYMTDGHHSTGTGWYAIDESKAAVSGSYTSELNETMYIDWIVEKIGAFQIDFKLYDNNTYLGTSSINRILSTVEVETKSSSTPDYRTICGNGNVSNFNSLDPNIAIVSSSGEISGISEGTTFISFTSTNGKAAVQVTVTKEVKTFAQLVIGTWIYDVPAEKSWERYIYEENGLISAQWSNDILKINESAQSTYKIDGQTVSFTLASTTGQLNMRFESESINEFNWTYKAYNDNYYSGKYTSQKMLASLNMDPGDILTPDYKSLTNGYDVTAYSSHNESIAIVDASTGTITATSKGRTYIDVQTSIGTAVVEINADGSSLPYDFHEFIGKPASEFEALFGVPFYEDESYIIYDKPCGTIDMLSAQKDSFSDVVTAIVVYYNDNVNTNAVTCILNTTFIPYTSKSTETFKAYMDTENLADATIGVTWDINSKTLTYVNLAKDLFKDYSCLLGKTRTQVITKMGGEPNIDNPDSQSYFFFDNKGISIVSAYYTDFTKTFDNVHSVVVMFDETLTVEQITNYLKRKYPFYPEYSSVDELVFVPEDHTMEIYYMPEDKMVMYFSNLDNSSFNSKMAVVRKLKAKIKTMKH